MTYDELQKQRDAALTLLGAHTVNGLYIFKGGKKLVYPWLLLLAIQVSGFLLGALLWH